MPSFRIWLSPPHMSGHEQAFVTDAFESNWIAPLGPHVDAFERELATYVGTAHAAALASGTAAIHLALLTLGVRPGDKVICSSFTFAGSVNPIRYCGAEPVLIDSEPDTWNMCPTLLEQAFDALARQGTPPKAVILVDLYGIPPKIEQIADLCAHYKCPLIEDAAEALGSTYKGQRLGSFGRIGILSFNGNKIITTSGGGALLSDDETLVKAARFLSTQARDPAPHYEHSSLGYNYRMSNILAAIGRGQMKVLDERVAHRRRVHGWYRELLGNVPGIEFAPLPPDCESNQWLTTVLLPNSAARDRVISALAATRIESRPLWKPMHLQPLYASANAFISGISQRLFERGLCLPSGSALTESEIQEVAGFVRGVLG